MHTILKFQLLVLIVISPSLFAQQDSFFGAPVWSPDGKAFTYISNVSGNNEVHIYNLKRKTNQQITFTSTSEWSPTWSPDGRSIVFISDRDGNKEIYVYNIKTKKQQRITNTPGIEEGSPSWFPDSKTIVITSRPSGSKIKRRVHALSPDGTIKDITPNIEYDYIYPKISPKEKKLLFGSRLKQPGQSFHIKVADIKTKTVQQLENMPKASYNPSWSYNGEKILFINQSDSDIANAAIYRMDIDGSNLEKMLDCETGCFQARLSPNGKSIIFRNGWMKDSHKGIFIMDIRSKKISKIIGK